MSDPIPWQVVPERAGRDGTWLLQRDGATASIHESQADAALAGVECVMREAGQGVPGRLRVLAVDGKRVVMERDYAAGGQPQLA